MKNLRISDSMTLPQEALTQTFAILAKRGVGKTYTASVMVEEMLKANLQVVVADPVGVWWGLRSAANGKDEGLSIIVMGGEHGDVPMDEDSGEIVANFVVESGRSVVLDFSGFRKGQQTRFMTDFAECLYHRNRAPMHLLVDEADAFAPQRPQPGEQRMLGAMEDLVRRGRARGIGVTLITQRPAVLNKNVLTQIEVLVCLRMIAPQDRAAIDAWIQAHGTPEQREQLMTSLPALEIGTAWFWSPGWDLFMKTKVRRRETFDSSSTPKIGDMRISPTRLKPVDLAELSDRMKEAIEAKRENDPKELKARIAELQRENADFRSAKIEVRPILTDGDRKVLQAFRQEAESAQIELDSGMEALATMRSIYSEMVQSIERMAGTRGTHANMRVNLQMRESHIPNNREKLPSQGLFVATGGMKRMMIALAQRKGLSSKQLGVRAGLSSSSGTFATYLAKLRSKGWIDGSRDRMELTAEGLRSLGSYTPLPTGKALLTYWLGELGGGAARMLKELASVHPRGLSREQLGQAAGIAPTSGTFATYLARLRSLELVTGRSEIRASDELIS